MAQPATGPDWLRRRDRPAPVPPLSYRGLFSNDSSTTIAAIALLFSFLKGNPDLFAIQNAVLILHNVWFVMYRTVRYYHLEF